MRSLLFGGALVLAALALGLAAPPAFAPSLGSGARKPKIDDTSPDWSPSGRSLLFVRRFTRGEKITSAIYTIRADGRGLRRITRGRHSETAPSWSPDGRRIAFFRRIARYRSALYIMRSDGSRPQRILVLQGGASVLSWSPDGRALALNILIPDMIYIVHLGEPTSLTPLDRGGHPSWSRTGKIAFTWVCFGLFTIDPDGSNRRAILGGENGCAILEVRYSYPDWSPDGARIAYTYLGKLSNRAVIKVVRADGTGLPVQLREGYEPDWSPDGRKLAFVRETKAGLRIFTMNADGTKVRPLTSGRR